MKIRNVLRIAVVAIRRNAVRSALTMLGVIIGVASVIAMISLASGDNFTARDVLVAEKVALLGQTVTKTLFPDQDPVGQIIRVKNLPFRVLGVLSSKGQGQWGQDQDDLIVAPYTTVQKKLLGI